MSKNLEFKLLVPPGACKLRRVSCNAQQSYFFQIHIFFKKIFFNKMSLKNPKTLRKYYENLMIKLQFLKPLIFLKPIKSYKIE